MSVETTEVIEKASRANQLSETVINAVADAKGVETIELETRLYDIIDPDALENIFKEKTDGTARTNGRIVFSMCGCEVIVYSDGQVVVTPPSVDNSKNSVAVSKE